MDDCGFEDALPCVQTVMIRYLGIFVMRMSVWMFVIVKTVLHVCILF